MKVVLYGLLGIIAAVAAWIVWRLGSVSRGARQRDTRILRELAEIEAALRANREVPAADIAPLAARPHLRRLLFGMLRQCEKVELFPEEHLGRRSQAEAALVYWLMHPNELQDPPADLQHVATLSRDVQGKKAEFEIFRYKMPAGHWAGSEWILGLAGPFFAGDAPYAGVATGWSVASETEGRSTPESVLHGYLARVGVSTDST
jgi:hypothetical protein